MTPSLKVKVKSPHFVKSGENLKDVPKVGEMSSPQPVWDYALRIKDQIKQVHMSERPLSESEIKLIPDYAWVDTYYLDKKWSLKSWLKQYDKQKNLLATQTSTLKGDLEESIKKMEAMKYNEPLDNEMRIVNMMVNSCVMIIREDILNSL